MADHQHQELPSPTHIGISGTRRSINESHGDDDHHDFALEDIHHLLGGLDDVPAAAAAPAAPPPGSSGCVTTTTSFSNPRTFNRSASGVSATSGAVSDAGVDPEAKAQARTERKRSREKQRRNDVNRQFADLTALLRQIEKDDPDETRCLPAYTPSNRVELMGRTVGLLQNLHEGNKKRKKEIADLEKQLEEAKKAGEETAAKLKESMMAPQTVGPNRVMMMVPMVIGGDNSHGNPAAAATTPAAGGGAAVPPWMAPYMMPSMPTAVAPTPAASSVAAPSPAAAAAPASTTQPMQMPHPMMMPQMQMPWTAMMMPQQPAATTMQPTVAVPAAAPTPSPNTMAAAATNNAKQAPASSNLAHCA